MHYRDSGIDEPPEGSADLPYEVVESGADESTDVVGPCSRSCDEPRDDRRGRITRRQGCRGELHLDAFDPAAGVLGERTAKSATPSISRCSPSVLENGTGEVVAGSLSKTARPLRTPSGCASYQTHPMVLIGRGYNMQIYICPTSFDHPHLENMQ